MVIFDIGANLGLFADAYLKTYPVKKIVLCEANPDLIPFLKEKYKDNSKVIIINKLISSTASNNNVFFVSNGHTISTASKDWVNNSRFTSTHSWNKQINLESITLDNLIELHGSPDLIKIDVEGYEDHVIQGLTKKQKDLCFEWTEEQYDVLEKCCNHLKYIGYDNFGTLFNTDSYLQKPDIFYKLEDLNIKNLIVPQRKSLWGMMWVK